MIQLDGNTILSTAYDLRTGGSGDQVTVIHLTTGEYFCFAGVGAYIWQRIQEKPIGLHWLVVELTEKFNCDYPLALRDAVRFCTGLVEERLLTAVQYNPETGEKVPVQIGEKVGKKNAKSQKK